MKYIKSGVSLPKILVFLFLVCLIFGNSIPIAFKQVAYAMSLTIKSGLIFILPGIVFVYICSSVLEMRNRNAFVLMVIILFSICFSNFISAMIAFFVGKMLIHHDWIAKSVSPTAEIVLKPYWSVNISPLVSCDKALVTGILCGVVFSFKSHPKVTNLFMFLRDLVNQFLNKVFIPIVPIFVFGFFLKLQHENTLQLILRSYGPILILVATLTVSYLALLYLIGSGFKLSRWIEYIKNIIPSVISGFSTMSSAASMPLTLEAASKNTQNPQLSRVLVPMTVNNHLIGDGLFIPLMGLILLMTSTGSSPGFLEYLGFAFYFVMAKFAVAAVPGGGIVVMLPVLEKTLGLNGEMLSLITAMYILFDPFITAANVAGNGAFSILTCGFSLKLNLRNF